MGKVSVPPPDDNAVHVLGRVVAAIADGRDGDAATELVPIAGQTLLTQPVDRMPALADASQPRVTGARTRTPGPAIVAPIYVRDHFLCVYCGRRTVLNPIMRLVSKKFPDQFPFHPHWKKEVGHRLYWDISTTVDHVDAVSVGGSWNFPENLVTACARCQYQKRNRSLESLGWQRQRVSGGWDGLAAYLEPLWERLHRPRGDYREWLRALRVAISTREVGQSAP
jgi:5-methylcytosine-specific restriction endonuclease McrA